MKHDNIIEYLTALKLHGMKEAFIELKEQTDYSKRTKEVSISMQN